MSLENDLSKLERLRKLGKLSEAQYRSFKTRILADHNSPVSDIDSNLPNNSIYNDGSESRETNKQEHTLSFPESRDTEILNDKLSMSSEETVEFDTGVSVTRTEKYVSIQSQNSTSNRISVNSITGFEYNLLLEHTISSSTLFFRFIAASFIVCFFLAFIADRFLGIDIDKGEMNDASESFTGFATSVGLIFVVIAFNMVLFGIYMVDNFLNLGIVRSVLNAYFSRKYYAVIIKTTANPVEFVAYPNELRKIKQIEKFILKE